MNLARSGRLKITKLIPTPESPEQLSVTNNYFMKKTTKIIAAILTGALVSGCAVVDVTKTASGFHQPTNPNLVQILKTVPDKKYIELGTITVTGFAPSETAKMHNAVRTKSAALGADAAILTEEGLLNDGWSIQKWATGVAIKFQ